MRVIICLLLAIFCFEGPAFAASEPIIAPAPDWVEVVPVPRSNPALADRPLQTLMVTAQSRYDTDHYDHYGEYAVAIQNAQGLQAAGNVTIPWQPDQSDLAVHKVRILRGNQVIDLLANGQAFTVLRRESNLETAMLDGVLTAVLQPEGLAVGDILNVAFSIRRRPGPLGLRGENFLFAVRGQPVRQVTIRQIWPTGVNMRWQGAGLYGNPRILRTSQGTELRLERQDLEAQEAPSQAPGRFALSTALEVSGYQSWTEISRAFAPLYARAMELGPNSPIRAQIDRIAAASVDPRARAIAALRLVQDETRYLALSMGEGHLTPATADQTWTRRYGDCKGKTVLLLALLHGLGIEAEPVVVNSRLGDAVRERLPQVGAFDHVIVRARIGGTSYWLDGTRSGDRSIDDLVGAGYGWALPLRIEGAELEPIPVPSPTLPTMAAEVIVDASRGFADNLPFRAQITFRGDIATIMRAGLAQTGRDAFVEQIRSEAGDHVPGEMEITSFDIREDDGSGGFVILMNGTGRMNWQRVPGGNVDEYRFDNSTISWSPSVERPAGPLRDAPFAFEVPYHETNTETIILPNGGRGYSMEGSNFDRTIAGTRLSRESSIVDGRAVVRTAIRRLQREVPAREMRAAIQPLRAISDDNAYLRAPPGTVVQRASSGSTAGGTSGRAEAGELVDRGHELLQNGEIEQASAAFAEAAELAPQWSRPVANHAIAMIHQRHYDEAERLLQRAAALDANDFVVSQGRGMLHLARGEAEPAIAQFTRSLELDPNNNFSLLQRSSANRQAGRIDAALADLDAVLEGEPNHVGALVSKARLLAWQNHVDRALALVDARLAANESDVLMVHLRAEILGRSGRAEEARVAYARTLEMYEQRQAQGNEGPSESTRAVLLAGSGQIERAVDVLDEALEQTPDDPSLLNERCWLRATSNVELEAALADCERAITLRSDSASYLDSRAMVRLRMGQIDRAIADASAALALNSQLAPSLFVRGVARIRNGEREAGEADLAEARRLQFDIDAEYREYGVTP